MKYGKAVAAPCALALFLGMPLGMFLGISAASATAAEPVKSKRVIEEVIVTARQKKETLQDVPVTISAFTEGDLDKYNVTNLIEASTLVPNLLIFEGGSGNGSNLYLRGVGSSSTGLALRIASLNPIEPARWKDISDESTSW